MDNMVEYKNGFEVFQIDPLVIKGISEAKYRRPTEVQQKVIPVLLKHMSVVVQSKTGTGKTAAFAIPILNDVCSGVYPHLVLAPTRELAEQISDEFMKLSKFVRVSVATLIGGLSINPQIDRLKRGPQVLVGTPGRILDHVERGTLDLSIVRTVVVDEADRMLDMGFIDDVGRILRKAENAKQVSMFSATIPYEVERLARNFCGNYEFIKLAGDDEFNVESIEHYVVDVYAHTKDVELEKVLRANRGVKTLVFTATKRRSEQVGKMLRSRNFRAGWINGDMSQAQREAVMSRFRSGVVDILVATDVAARGIDVSGVGCVVNYDVPQEPLTYVHRTGRTGRMGRKGLAITLVSPRDRQAFSNVELALNRRIPDLKL
ncbi:MAG: DEAD/DEAH box helicase [Thermoprotei archaeon]